MGHGTKIPNLQYQMERKETTDEIKRAADIFTPDPKEQLSWAGKHLCDLASDMLTRERRDRNESFFAWNNQHNPSEDTLRSLLAELKSRRGHCCFPEIYVVLSTKTRTETAIKDSKDAQRDYRDRITTLYVLYNEISSLIELLFNHRTVQDTGKFCSKVIEIVDRNEYDRISTVVDLLLSDVDVANSPSLVRLFDTIVESLQGGHDAFRFRERRDAFIAKTLETLERACGNKSSTVHHAALMALGYLRKGDVFPWNSRDEMIRVCEQFHKLADKPGPFNVTAYDESMTSYGDLSQEDMHELAMCAADILGGFDSPSRENAQYRADMALARLRADFPPHL